MAEDRGPLGAPGGKSPAGWAANRPAAPAVAPRTAPSASVLPRPGRIWSQVLAVAAALGTVPVLEIWWSNTSPGSLAGVGGYLTAAGRVTGLLAAYLLLVLVALMARIPWLEDRVGSDVLARHHRALGEYTVVLALAHTVLIIIGYATQDHVGLVSETTQVVLDFPDVLMATVSLGLLIMVGLVSARAVRKKMAYETWHFIHLYVYLAMALAFSHEFSVGTDFAESRRVRVAWSAVHILVALALIYYRLLVPVLRSLRHDLRVAKVTREGPGVVSIYLAGRHLNRLGAQPGQFFRWRFLTRDRWWQSNPYSLSAAPDGRQLRITVKALGDSSRSLARVKPGTRVWIEGPYGAFTARRAEHQRSLLIAGGAGITPIRALYESLPGVGDDVILLYRAGNAQDLVLYRELEAIARRRGFGLYPLVGPRQVDGHGGRRAGASADPLSHRALAGLVPDLTARDVYLCGPPGLTGFATAQLRRAGVSRSRIHTEAFDL
ncbi:MAG TPA: ferredoxin reductase family protein [Actinocrinis sp.]|nr:ferredoxin reductase family protein [Actinocrinis sp.]